MRFKSLKKKKCLLDKTGLLLLFFLFFCFGCPQPGSPGTTEPDNPSEDLTIEEMLDNLDIPMVNTEPVDDFNQPVGDRNPMGNTLVTFIPKFEFFLSSNGGASHIYSGLDKVSPSITEVQAAHNTTSWMDLPKKAINADMNGDGYEEIVMVAFDVENGDIEVRSCEYRETFSEGQSTPQTAGPSTHPISVDEFTNLDYVKNLAYRETTDEDSHYIHYFKRDITAGDFDNNGRVDVVFSVNRHVFLCEYTGATSYTVREVLNGLSGPRTRVEAGDLNNDSYCDLVLLDGEEDGSTASYYIFEGSENGLGMSTSAGLTASDFNRSLKVGSEGFSSAEMAIGDINGDSWNDIVFGGVQANDRYEMMYLVVDPYNEDIRSFDEEVLFSDEAFCRNNDFTTFVYHRNSMVPRIVAGDFNGDGRDEFGIMDYFYTCDSNGDLQDFTEGVFGSLTRDRGHHNYMYFDNAVVGDVTGDCRDDLVFLEIYDYNKPNELIEPKDFDKLVVWGSSETDTVNLVEIYESDVDCDDSFPTLTLANINNDSTVLKFNRREFQYSGPQILAVLASPPYNSYINTDNSTTEYSSGSGTSSDESKSYGFSVGASFGADLGFSLFEILSFERGITYSTEKDFAWGWQKSSSQSITYSATCPAGKNSVRFTAIPLDIYIYDVVSKPADSTLGETLTITIPRDPGETTYRHLELNEYNSKVSEQYRIPDELIHHVIGEPDSYYRRDEIVPTSSSYKFTVYGNAAESVSVGDGLLTSVSVTKETGTASTYDFNSSESVEYNETIALVDYTVGGGYQYSYSCSNYHFTDYSITGTVGAIPVDAPDSAQFNYGLLEINQRFNNQNYSLFTYWVE